MRSLNVLHSTPSIRSFEISDTPIPVWQYRLNFSLRVGRHLSHHLAVIEVADEAEVILAVTELI